CFAYTWVEQILILDNYSVLKGSPILCTLPFFISNRDAYIAYLLPPNGCNGNALLPIDLICK
ncbi:hypothetical protein V2W45_1236929, partial [Cenococcum geophilum]